MRARACSSPWRRSGAALAAALVLAASSASAFIERMYSLQEVLNESTHVVVGRLDTVDEKARTAVLAGERALKGPLDYPKINLNIALGPGPHANYMLELIEPGKPAIIFYKQQDKRMDALLHTADCWFQFVGNDDPKAREKVWWRLTHVEIRMGRTYNGATGDLIKLTEDVLSKRVAPPAPDPKVPPVNVNRPPLLAAKAGGQTNGFFRQIQLAAGADRGVRGVSFADVNGDGLPDVHLCRQTASLLLLNQGGKFRELAGEWGIGAGRRAGVWADYDGDGKPDLLSADFKLFRNQGASFKASDGLPAAARETAHGAAWLDVNGDGWPDALLANGEDGLRLYQNPGPGQGRFADISEPSGLGPKGPGATAGDYLAVFDANGDGRADFFYNSGEGLLALNHGDGKFRILRDTGLQLAAPGYKRGLAVADVDGDGDPDVFVPGPEGGRLLRNDNNGRFTDITARAGDLASLKGPCFAGAWGDVNGDGAPDLFVCQTAGPGCLLLNNGHGAFSDIAAQVGLEALTPSFAAGFADLDQDGDLDLVVNLKDKIVVAFNDLPRRADRQPVAVDLKVRQGAIGAAVRVLDEGRRLVAWREINGAASCGGQESGALLFHLPSGAYRLYAALSDGRLGRKELLIGTNLPLIKVTFADADCQ